MRLLFYASFVFNLLSAAVIYVLSPPRVVAHFDAVGKAGGWMPKETQTAYLIGMGVFVGIVFEFVHWLLHHKVSLVNVPNPAYWKKEENLPQLRKITAPFLWECGIYLMLFPCAIEWVSFRANRLNPPHMGFERDGVLALFSAALVILLFRILRAYRIPAQEMP